MADINKHIPVSDEIKNAILHYLPPKNKKHVTLTYAQSLDSRIAAKKDERTAISSLETKRMTHWLRAHHDGILVGVQTAIVDDPALHCKSFIDDSVKLHNESPRPIILDPNFRWEFQNTKLALNAIDKGYKAPVVVIKAGCNVDESSKQKQKSIEDFGGTVLALEDYSWKTIFDSLSSKCGLKSVMVEGGSYVIESLLDVGEFDSLIITIGPVFLGKEGLEVSPPHSVSLEEVRWVAAEKDSIMCARLRPATTIA